MLTAQQIRRMNRTTKAMTPVQPTWQELVDELKADLVDAIRTHKRVNPLADMPLPDLYREVCESKQITLGMFHDCLRIMVQDGRVRLHPFTGAAYQLQDGEYGLVAGQEIKYYVEVL